MQHGGDCALPPRTSRSRCTPVVSDPFWPRSSLPPWRRAEGGGRRRELYAHQPGRGRRGSIYAMAVNDAGQVAGYSNVSRSPDAGRRHGCGRPGDAGPRDARRDGHEHGPLDQRVGRGRRVVDGGRGLHPRLRHRARRRGDARPRHARRDDQLRLRRERRGPGHGLLDPDDRGADPDPRLRHRGRRRRHARPRHARHGDGAAQAMRSTPRGRSPATLTSPGGRGPTTPSSRSTAR